MSFTMKALSLRDLTLRSAILKDIVSCGNVRLMIAQVLQKLCLRVRAQTLAELK